MRVPGGSGFGWDSDALSMDRHGPSPREGRSTVQLLQQNGWISLVLVKHFIVLDSYQ